MQVSSDPMIHQTSCNSFFPWEICVLLHLFLFKDSFFFYFMELSIGLNFSFFVYCPDKNSASSQSFRSSQWKRDSRVLLLFWRHRIHWDPWVSFFLCFSFTIVPSIQTYMFSFMKKSSTPRLFVMLSNMIWTTRVVRPPPQGSRGRR